MLDNVGRKITAIVVSLVAALAFLVLKDPPFQLGLDIEGGTRMLYSIDFDTAYEEGRLDPSEDRQEVVAQIIDIIRNRVDPAGNREPNIRAVGDNQIMIELPGQLGVPSKEASSTLSEPLAQVVTDDMKLADISEFPDSGIVKVGSERIRYTSKGAGRLFGLERGRNSQPMSHAAGETVELVQDDGFKAAIESLGELKFRILAEDAHMPTGTDLEKEREKLDEWAEANPNSPLSAFNGLAPEEGGPDPSIEWFAWYPQDENDLRTPIMRATAVERPQEESQHFEGSALSAVRAASDQFGFGAVGFEIAPARRADFGEFTGENLQRRMAIVLNNEIRTAPTLNSKLTSGGQIEGRFSDEEVRNLMTVLRSGSLKIKPTLENDERVGATLGDAYVARGEQAAATAILLVLGFIIFYYKRLGVIAGASLVASFILLMGALSFGNATLTLPGIAGLILTVGMAVDANILIFDRIREEKDKGRNVKQAAKDGFDKAMPAILDANITTFLTAWILRSFGTGPVRGFAVTLMWGVVTSVFAALVITRVLVHFSLLRGMKEIVVGQWMVEAKYQFMSKGKTALMASSVAMLTGLALFAWEDENEKLGIDFVGGVETQLQTTEAHTTQEMRERIEQLDIIGESADVKAVLSSASGDGYKLFRATFKTSDGTSALDDANVRALLHDKLGDLILKDAVTVTTEDGDGVSNVEVDLRFQESHATDAIASVLATVGLNNAKVSPTDEANHYVATATTAFGRDPDEILAKLNTAFGDEYKFAEGIPSYSKVGAAVVAKLRDDALKAMLISLFVIVLYIRVRFAEYSFGFAAVAALAHDVLITLGVLTAANHFGILNGEINLPMIAAFLTIIGYSLNDTIVIFDRVRENTPRMKKPLSEILDTSINQTLSRTILTSFTTFLAVAILYLFNIGTGNVLESFSFAMMIGVITGTYSTIFIANPVLLYLEKRAGRVDERGMVVVPQKPTDSGKSDEGVHATAKV